MNHLIKASAYYGRHATGWVAVIRGYPYHCHGLQGKREAKKLLELAK